MEQIILLIDEIILSQQFLKSNYYTLNEYWIKPRISFEFNQDPNYIPDLKLQSEIDQTIQSIDKNLCLIIEIIQSNNIFQQILETKTLYELENLAFINITGISFMFGITGEFAPKLINDFQIQIDQMESNDLINLFRQFISEFKNVFGYNFLDLLTDEITFQIVHTCLHIKKLYLEYYNTKKNET